MKDGSAVFVKELLQLRPKKRTPFDDTVTCDVLAPNPLNVNPSGMEGEQLSSPSVSTCVHPERSSMLNCMSNVATIVSASPAGPCGPTGPCGPAGPVAP